MLDLLIAGGGPAGLVTALFAAQAGLDVEVIEPRVVPIDKACGEGLMPGASDALGALLAQQNVALPGLPFEGIRYLDGAGRRVDARFRHGPGLGVRRTALHAALSAAVVRAGVTVATGKVTALEQDDASVRAAARTARYLVAADGLHSPIRRLVGLQRPDRRAPRWGLRRHYACPPWSSFVEVHWASSAELYVTPVAPDLVGIAVLARGTGDFETRLAQFPLLRRRLADAAPASAVRGAGPLRQPVASRRSGRVMLVGDAAGYVDALTGEGLAIAISSARAAVDCILHDHPEDYERRWRAASRRSRVLTEALLASTRRPVVRRALVPAARRLPFIFSAAVDQLAR